MVRERVSHLWNLVTSGSGPAFMLSRKRDRKL